MITPLLGRGDNPRLSFRSDRVEQIAGYLNSRSLSSLADGEHYRCIQYKGTPVTIIKEKGVIEHIGYSLFTPLQRAAIGKIPCNFLERYLLDIDIPQIQEKEVLIRQLEDGFNFVSGSKQSLLSLCRDTTQSLSINLIGDRKYLFRWNDGSVVFPVDNELLFGRNQIENERRLPDELSENNYYSGKSIPSIQSLVSADGNLFELKGDFYYTEKLSGSTYYAKDSFGHLGPVNDISYPKETIANYLGGLLDGSKVTVHVKMRVYRLKSIYFNVPLSSILAYANKNECMGFWGVISSEEDTITGEWILRNAAGGFNHVFRLQIPMGLIRDGGGEVMALLTPFVPTHSIKYLFGEIQR